MSDHGPLGYASFALAKMVKAVLRFRTRRKAGEYWFGIKFH